MVRLFVPQKERFSAVLPQTSFLPDCGFAVCHVFELLLKLPYKTIKKSVVRLNHAFLFCCNENYFITSPSFLKKSMRRLQSASALAKSSSALAGLVLVKLA